MEVQQEGSPSAQQLNLARCRLQKYRRALLSARIRSTVRLRASTHTSALVNVVARGMSDVVSIKDGKQAYAESRPGCKDGGGQLPGDR